MTDFFVEPGFTWTLVFSLLAWLHGCFWGAYRYERLFHDRSVSEIIAEIRRNHRS